MKRNALFRIILWSIVIAILATIMVGIGFGISFNRSRRNSYLEETAVLVTEPVMIAANAEVIDEINIRKMPSTEAPAVGMLQKGEHVTITRSEFVNGQRWDYITSPTTGWVLREYLNAVEPAIQETMVCADTRGQDTFPASSIRELDIEWVAGDITIYPGTTDQITVQEDGVTDDKYVMYLKQEGDTLDIRFSHSEHTLIGLNKLPEKDLTITVPADWICNSLEIEAASAKVEVCDLTIRDVDFDGASGTCSFENCTVDQLDIDTASGDVRFVGSLDILDCDAASANVYAVLSNIPNRLDMDMMSGDLELALPADAGFTLSMDALSEKLDTDFELTHRNGNLVAGDGSCRILIDALSGDVAIRKCQ